MRLLQCLLLNIALWVLFTIISLDWQDSYTYRDRLPEIQVVKKFEMNNANCSLAWRQKHQIPLSAQFVNEKLVSTAKRKNNRTSFCNYKFKRVPKGTFTYWLSHIESQNRIRDKAYFADKFLMKEYIQNYTKQYGFSHIKQAKLLFDFGEKPWQGFQRQPTPNELNQFQQIYTGFVVKPSHFAGTQIVINKTENITAEKYRQILTESQKWSKRKYYPTKRGHTQGFNREPWYLDVKPRIFIEENIQSLSESVLREYKISVFNGKALFAYTHIEGYIMSRMRILPGFIQTNVMWCRAVIDSKYGKGTFNESLYLPSPQNLQLMIEFAEHWANTEKWNYVRVDLYEVNNQIYFSEFTFAPISGTGVIRPLSFDYLLYDILCDTDNEQNLEKIYDYAL